MPECRPFQDLRYAARTLRKSPGFTTVAVLTLALGIGANTAIFSFVDGVLLKPLPYAQADRIVRVLEKPPQGERNGISTLNFLDWQKDNTVFDFMAAPAGGGGDAHRRRRARAASRRRGSRRDYFDIFGIQAALGRTFLPGEDQLGKDQVVILSHALWASQFGADPPIVNRTILLDNEPHTVVGVLPAGSAFDRAFNQIWRPLAFEPSNMTRDFHWLTSFARLKHGVSLEQARPTWTRSASASRTDFPDSNKGWGVIVERYADTLIGPGAADRAAGADVRHRPGAPHRMRQPGESRAGARRVARARSRGPRVARRGALAADSPVPDRERPALARAAACSASPSATAP